MDSFHFQRGKAFFSSDSSAVPWAATFEDEGPSGYFYARDRTKDSMESSILDAMLIYNNSSQEETDREHLASIQWSRDGLQCVLYIDGTAQAFLDFAARQSFCRSNFPNFLDQQGAQGATWRASSHAWDDAAVGRFEAGIYS